jgi:hypothetical protein
MGVSDPDALNQEIMIAQQFGLPDPRGPRKLRRRKVKNRGFTKKGMTRLIKVDKTGRPVVVLTEVGSKLHKKAIKNSKKVRKDRLNARKNTTTQGG